MYPDAVEQQQPAAVALVVGDDVRAVVDGLLVAPARCDERRQPADQHDDCRDHAGATSVQQHLDRDRCDDQEPAEADEDAADGHP